MLVGGEYGLDEPDSHLLTIRRRRFAELQDGPNLSTMLPTHAPFPVIVPPQGRFQFELVSDIIHHGFRHLMFPRKKAAFILKALEEQGKAQAGGTRFVGKRVE